jgi:outer membrane protein assembly factor BamB
MKTHARSSRWWYLTLSLLVLPGMQTAVAQDSNSLPTGTEFQSTNAPPPGKKLWELDLGSIYASPAIATDGTVYLVAGNPDSTLHALTPGGVKKWETFLGRSGSSPAIGADGTIYVGVNKTFRAYDPNGTLLWSFSFPDTQLFYYVTAPAIAEDGTLYVGTGTADKSLYALTPDGTLKWKFTAAGAFAEVYTPVVGTDGTIYFGSYDDGFYAVNPDGTRRWYFPMNGYNISAAIGGDIYVVGSISPNKLFAFTPGGVKKWETQIGPSISQGSSAPVIGPDDTIFVGCGHDIKLYAFNPDGTAKWNFAAGGNVGGTSPSPAVDSQGNVYVGFGVTFHAVSSTGSLLWSFSNKGIFTAPNLTPDGTIYVGSAADKAYAFRANAGLAESPWPMFQRDLKHTGAAPLIPATNHSPMVEIITPTNGAAFLTGENILLGANASDSDGSVTQVEFFEGHRSLGLATGPLRTPYGMYLLSWSNAAPGFYTLTARATDNLRATDVSAPVNVTIVTNPPPPTNRPPEVNIVARDPFASEGTNFRSDWDTNRWRIEIWNPWRVNIGGTNSATFVVRRHRPTDDALVVHYETSGTASNGVDYVALPGSVIIPAGKRTAQIVVAPIDDNRAEGIETVALILKPSPDYAVGFPSHAAAIIIDNDRPRPPCVLLPDHQFHFCQPASNGFSFRVEASTDLRNWVPLCTNVVTDGALHFVDPDAPPSHVRFYRVEPEPGLPLDD